MRLSLKLGGLCAAAAFLPLFVASFVVILKVSSSTTTQVRENLQMGARAASALYDKRLIELRAAATQIAENIYADALVTAESSDRAGSAWARRQDLLTRSQNDFFLDFVILTDPLGRVLARHNERPAPNESLLSGDDKSLLVEKVLNTNTAASACAIERGERYQHLWLDRVAKVKLSDGSAVDEALVAEAAAPVIGGGRLIGVVLIGQMLNTYWKPRPGVSGLQMPLVAEARQMFSRNADDDSGSLISNNRAVIASSIPPASSGRDSASDPILLGVLRDPTKTDDYLKQGDSSYVVAWQPLKALDGNVLGSIGVARSSREISNASDSVRSTLLVIGSIATVLAATAGFLFGRLLGARVDDLREAASRWTVGELSAPANDQDLTASNGFAGFLKRDEIAVLAGQMEQMRMSFRLAIERLRKR